MAATALSPARRLERIFDPGEASAIYQPIVELATGQVVAAEALARWPGLGVGPDVAFAHARRTNRVAELDVVCQRAALAGARAAGLSEGFTIFVNTEPGTSVGALLDGRGDLRVVAEITERALLSDPGRLLRSIRDLRDRGFGIALDDVGAVPDSLALLPFVAPDVVKLDVSLVQAWPNAEQAGILTAVAAYAERSGATILAEGIETTAHLDQALALGATVGQGWHFSRPGQLGRYPGPSRPVPIGPGPAPSDGTPFELIDPGALRIGTKGLLLSISRHIEQQGMRLESPPLVLGAFQEAGRFTPATAHRYRQIAERCPLVVALGAGMAAEPVRGVRGSDLRDDDPLHGEWTVVVVGPHYSGALIAKDLGDRGPDLQRRYVFTLTHSPDTVTRAARCLLARIDPVAVEP